MSRYRLEPTSQQANALLRHCADARYVWNLCVEQEACRRAGRGRMPGLAERCRQLTEARADNPWLAGGSVIVQQQAIRDHTQAMARFFAGACRRPRWRRRGEDEGFRIVAVGPGDMRRLNRRHGEVKIPKVGWVRFRWSRAVPAGVRSFRVTQDRVGRWHVAFAHVPVPVPGPGTGQVVGIDRGVAVSAVLSTGESLRVPGLSRREAARLRRLERKLAKARRGSARRGTVKAAVARLKAREADRRKDWAEQASTGIARRFDVIRVEDLDIRAMTRSARGTADAPGRNVAAKAGLNRGILRSGWGLLVRRIADKAPGRVEKVPPAFTSQCCSACGHVAAESRESQALFRCVACGFACNADMNAARNIAAGHAVKARGGDAIRRPANREPQLCP
ncbi:MAG: (cytosine-5-)-methyltransferase [Actinomycetia bacterium]|nr:(cytosine-5-)-methyltransferase [Actinomycetes bacterium]